MDPGGPGLRDDLAHRPPSIALSKAPSALLMVERVCADEILLCNHYQRLPYWILRLLRAAQDMITLSS